MYTSIEKLHVTTDSMAIGQLVPKIPAFEGLQKQKETKNKNKIKKLSAFVYLKIVIFVSYDSFCLISSHYILKSGKRFGFDAAEHTCKEAP